MTTTPLIEHLREKKAAKDKPAAAKATSKHVRQDTNESKGDAADKKDSTKGLKEVAQSPDKNKRLSKAQKAAKEAVKVLTKEVATIGQAKKSETPSSATPAQASAAPSAPTAPAAERRRERGSASIAAKMLQRDLGIGPAGSVRRKSRREENLEAAGSAAKKLDTSTAENAGVGASTMQSAAAPKKDARSPRTDRLAQSALVERTNQDAHPQPTSDSKRTGTGEGGPPTILKKPSTSHVQPPKGPAASRQRHKMQPSSSSSSVNMASAAPNSGRGHERSPPGPASSTTASAAGTVSAQAPTQAPRQAFLKHANPSQGITETLLKEVLSSFGDIDSVVIDKRKGFAYADFSTPEGLQAAIKASPVKVAQGAVVVLERRDKPSSKTPLGGKPFGTDSGSAGTAVGAGNRPAGPAAHGSRGGRGRAGRGGGRGGAAAVVQTQPPAQAPAITIAAKVEGGAP